MSLKLVLETVVVVCCISVAIAAVDVAADEKDQKTAVDTPAPAGTSQAVKAEQEKVPEKGKSLLEPITLYPHDQAAGVYRTESGELVRMFRVERASGSEKAGSPGRRSVRKPDGSAPQDRQRMYDWMSQFYGNPYGGGLGSYSYNYNYANPYSSLYGNYYNPYGSYGGYSPYSYYGNYGLW